MEKLELPKPRGTVEISNNINLVQRKAFNCLMLQTILTPKPKGQKYHSITIKELCHLTGYKQNDWLYLDKQLEEMQKTLLQWREDSKRGRVQFLGHVEYYPKTGILEYSFSERLIDLVKENKIFHRLDFSSMRELTSKHALALYENCAGFRETKTYQNGTGWRALSAWKLLLCGEEEAYPEFKIFHRDVLKPAIKEVNEHTDIHIKMKTKKLGRKVEFLHFDVKTKDDYEAELLTRPSSPTMGAKTKTKTVEVEPQSDFNSTEEMLDFWKNGFF